MNTKNEIDRLNEAIACLEATLKVKGELIQHQNIMIKELKEYNAKLKEMLEKVLSF